MNKIESIIFDVSNSRNNFKRLQGIYLRTIEKESGTQLNKSNVAAKSMIVFIARVLARKNKTLSYAGPSSVCQ